MTPPTADPLPAIPLAYVEDRAARPWAALLRLMSLAAMAQGATAAAQALSHGAGRLVLFVPLVWDRLAAIDLAVDAGQAVSGATLAVGGVLAARRRRAGRRLVLAGAPAVVASLMARQLHDLWQYAAVRQPAAFLAVWVASGTLGTAAGVVLPAALWAFFRRPEVRAAMVAG